MTNALFLSSRWLNGATITASSAEGDLVPANVQTIDPTEVWRATGCAAEWLAWDMGSDVIVTALAAIAHNLSATATLRLRLASSTALVTAAPSVDSGVVSAWPASGKPPLDDWLYWFSLMMEVNTVGYRYGRLDIADPDNAAGYVEVGRLMAGPAFVPAMNVDINPAVGLVSADEALRTPFNHTVGDDRGPASRLMTVPMSAVNEDDMRDELFELQRYCGLAKDFAFCLDPDATDSFHLYAMQCRFASLVPGQLQGIFSDVSQLWQTTLNLEEIN